MNYRELFESVRRRPALHGLDGTYGSSVAFVLGCDAGTSGVLLAGFREWLIVRLGDGNNLSWPALVERIVGSAGSGADPANSSDLFELLDEFLVLRDDRAGMVKIFDSYLTWLKGQEWYRSEILE